MSPRAPRAPLAAVLEAAEVLAVVTPPRVAAVTKVSFLEPYSSFPVCFETKRCLIRAKTIQKSGCDCYPLAPDSRVDG